MGPYRLSDSCSIPTASRELAVVVVAEAMPVLRRPMCASTWSTLGGNSVSKAVDHVPHMHVLRRRSTVSVREAAECV